MSEIGQDCLHNNKYKAVVRIWKQQLKAKLKYIHRGKKQSRTCLIQSMRQIHCMFTMLLWITETLL